MNTKTVTIGTAEKKSSIDSNNDFGPWGWSMIIFSGLMYYMYAAWTADGLNVFISSFVKEKGWDAAELLALASPANWIGVLGAMAFGQMIIKAGPRMVTVVAMFFAGASVIWFGHVDSVMQYMLALAAIAFFTTGYGFVVPGTLMNVWFPRKKGLALGWATMGMPVCTATFVYLMTFLFKKFGFTDTYTIAGLFLMAMSLIAWFWIKDTPESVGCYPDNVHVSHENMAATLERMKNYTSPFTVARLLKDKDMWFISLGYGCLWLVTIGIVSQYVLRLMSLGYTEETAINMLAVAAICALPGSYLWGWLDLKWGTKKASVIYTATYIVILGCLVYEGGPVFTFFTSVLVGSGLAGIKELITSMTGSVYGRYDFAAANRVITPIANILRSSTFIVMGMSLMLTKSYSGAYLIFIVINIIGLVLISKITDECKGNDLEVDD